ncbi:hypothetical protein Dda_6252 [Drechslerella dactyloides]|uniref:Uncharacterized protein n=1 Tax=Drechslerella dactyloides TaxID=74499 RepID=A0AAD6IVZ4_DREDA|nr:hypothetical protein Dda_6252 [Drechslerella dactyloides]
MPPRPLAIVTSSPCSFLTYCIARSATTSSTTKDTIIICSTRGAFIRELLIDLHLPVADIPTDDTDEPLTDAQELILHTPIAALLATDTISIVYCPTIHHIRAYLSSLTSTHITALHARKHSEDANTTIIDDERQPYLAIHGLLPLHHLSTEWSAQGLSRTLASISDTATATSRTLMLSISADSRAFGIAAELPLINSRMMRKNTRQKGFYGGEGFEQEDGERQDLRFIGSVRDVLGRWCRVVEGAAVEGDVKRFGDRSSQEMLV